MPLTRKTNTRTSTPRHFRTVNNSTNDIQNNKETKEFPHKDYETCQTNYIKIIEYQ